MTKLPAHNIEYIEDLRLPPQRATRRESKSRPRRFAKAIKIAARYRHLVPRGRSILFFGTRNARAIIRNDRIQVHMNYPTISFTRSLHVAVHFAMLERDVEETTGAILILVDFPQVTGRWTDGLSIV
jgi:hypothetical protein